MSKKIILTGCYIMYALVSSPQITKANQQDTLQEMVHLDEVVITGTRFEVPVEKSGKTIYVLDTDDIRKNAGKTVADLLNEVPGIQVEGNFGSLGTNISIYARGSRNKNTLVLIDGIPLNDPSGTDAFYDLRLLPVSEIASIEILKGGLSTLYGTGASSSVISIKLKETKKDLPIEGDISFNYGSYKTANVNANIQGYAKRFSYLLSGNYVDAEGFSEALEKVANTRFEKDGFNQRNGLFKLTYEIDKSFEIETSIAYDKYETEYDDAPFLDAPENIAKGKMFRTGLIPTYRYDRGELKLKTIYAVNNREFVSSLPVEYDGHNLHLDLVQRHQITPSFTGLWGVNIQHLAYKERGEFESTDFGESEFFLTDPYASFFYEHSSGINLHLGGRFNRHSEYGLGFVYNVNPSYTFEFRKHTRIKLLASLATTYITPTGYQLYSSLGNEDLKPERSVNLEFGTSFYHKESLVMNVSFFTRDEKNSIDFVNQFDVNGNWIGGTYENLTRQRKVTGWETDLSYDFSTNLSFSIYYSNVSTGDISNFYRIPKNKFGGTVHISPWQNSSISVKYSFTGKRTVRDFSNTISDVSLERYGLFDIYAQHHMFKEKATLFGAVNNILNVDFTSILGYTTRGRNYNIGLKFDF